MDAAFELIRVSHATLKRLVLSAEYKVLRGRFKPVRQSRSPFQVDKDGVEGPSYEVLKRTQVRKFVGHAPPITTICSRDFVILSSVLRRIFEIGNFVIRHLPSFLHQVQDPAVFTDRNAFMDQKVPHERCLKIALVIVVKDIST